VAPLHRRREEGVRRVAPTGWRCAVSRPSGPRPTGGRRSPAGALCPHQRGGTDALARQSQAAPEVHTPHPRQARRQGTAGLRPAAKRATGPREHSAHPRRARRQGTAGLRPAAKRATGPRSAPRPPARSAPAGDRRPPAGGEAGPGPAKRTPPACVKCAGRGPLASGRGTRGPLTRGRCIALNAQRIEHVVRTRDSRPGSVTARLCLPKTKTTPGCVPDRSWVATFGPRLTCGQASTCSASERGVYSWCEVAEGRPS
jgi:hypothetical protein